MGGRNLQCEDLKEGWRQISSNQGFYTHKNHIHKV